MVIASDNIFDKDTIPVIDISSLRDGSNSKIIAKKLHEASQNLGFIYIKGHGIPDHIINNARKYAYDFFKSDPSYKKQVTISNKHRGWIGYGGAKMDDDFKPDYKESFLWGFEDKENVNGNDHPFRGYNQWPEFVPSLKLAATEYFAYAHEVAHHLMRGFALGLDLEESFFLKTADRPLSRGSFVYYPHQSVDMGKNQYGVAPHTDFGVLTVLCQDDIGGLQVQNSQGNWVDAPPIDGTLIVNVADLLHRWTEGAYKSTPHRVINNSGKERLSLVLAFDPNPETVIDACEIFGPAHKPKEEAITCGDYLIWRFNKAFSYRNKK